MMFWLFGEPCPLCGGKTEWRANTVSHIENKTFEVGKYHCLKCGSSSDLMEAEIEYNTSVETKNLEEE